MRFFEQSVETMPREALELLQTEKLYSMLENLWEQPFLSGKAGCRWNSSGSD
jgi:phenylacetate-coenzyme A ligase PaaK-like adenylate-forming protein